MLSFNGDSMKPRIDRGGNQGRDDPNSAAADRARLRRAAPWLVAFFLFLLIWI